MNKDLYNALKSDVSAGIDFVVEKARKEFQSEPNDETFSFAQVIANDDLTTLIEYRNCLEVLSKDAEIADKLNVLAGTNSGRRERTPTALGLMRSLLDLGFDRNRFVSTRSPFRTKAVFAPSRQSTRIRVRPLDLPRDLRGAS